MKTSDRGDQSNERSSRPFTFIRRFTQIALLAGALMLTSSCATIAEAMIDGFFEGLGQAASESLADSGSCGSGGGIIVEHHSSGESVDRDPPQRAH
jgi:hypothetical protein